VLESISAATVERMVPLCGVFICVFNIYFHRSIFMIYGKVKEFKMTSINEMAEWQKPP